MIEEAGRGVIVYQMQEGRGIGILNKIRAYALQDEGSDTVEANTRLKLPIDLREYRQCGEILLDLGLRRIRLLTNNPQKLEALQEVGLEIVERVRIEVELSAAAMTYMRTKKRRLGHFLQLVE
jgi:3,4-dihydroxy 2-butanone 4-phosphate synthase/GTP cyclohydrolase II